MKVSFKSLSLVAVVAVASLPAFAVPTLRITDCGSDGCGLGDSSVTITDQLAGDGNLINLGNVVFIGTIGNWSINIVSGSSKPVSGTASKGNLYVSSTNTYSGSGNGELKIEFSDDFFTGLPRALRLGTSASGTPFSVYSGGVYGSGNNLFEGNLADPTSVTENGTAFTGVFSNVRQSATSFSDASYSLTAIARIKATGANTGTFDMRLEAVPEPGFYGALALGLSGLFAAVARRRATAKE